VFPIRYFSEMVGIIRENFIKALNKEGVQFYQGYTKPLYLQPVYKKRQLFKYGYPFSAPVNKECVQIYNDGLCPISEKLHFKEIVINEHIRVPQSSEDIEDILESVWKIIQN